MGVCFDLIPQALLCLLLFRHSLLAISSWSSLLLHFLLAHPLCSTLSKTVISSLHKTREPFNSWKRKNITFKYPQTSISKPVPFFFLKHLVFYHVFNFSALLPFTIHHLPVLTLYISLCLIISCSSPWFIFFLLCFPVNMAGYYQTLFSLRTSYLIPDDKQRT